MPSKFPALSHMIRRGAGSLEKQGILIIYRISAAAEPAVITSSQAFRKLHNTIYCI
jgi:microcystin degradation protein MlrC